MRDTTLAFIFGLLLLLSFGALNYSREETARWRDGYKSIPEYKRAVELKLWRDAQPGGGE